MWLEKYHSQARSQFQSGRSPETKIKTTIEHGDQFQYSRTIDETYSTKESD